MSIKCKLSNGLGVLGLFNRHNSGAQPVQVTFFVFSEIHKVRFLLKVSPLVYKYSNTNPDLLVHVPPLLLVNLYTCVVCRLDSPSTTSTVVSMTVLMKRVGTSITGRRNRRRFEWCWFKWSLESPSFFHRESRRNIWRVFLVLITLNKGRSRDRRSLRPFERSDGFLPLIFTLNLLERRGKK